MCATDGRLSHQNMCVSAAYGTLSSGPISCDQRRKVNGLSAPGPEEPVGRSLLPVVSKTSSITR